jgi:hypothetical protein
LLTLAEAAGFEVLVTTDQNLSYQQNLTSRKIAIVVLGKGQWGLIKAHIPPNPAMFLKMRREAPREIFSCFTTLSYTRPNGRREKSDGCYA